MHSHTLPAKKLRKQILSVVRSVIPENRRGILYCDKRKTSLPTNIGGHTIKWWLAKATDEELFKINSRIKEYGVEVRVVSVQSPLVLGFRMTYSLQAFNIN